MPDDVSMPDPSTFVAVAAASQQRLVAHLDDLLAADRLDVTAPSRLPEWTIGHVIAHVTNSGDGYLRMLDAAARGDVGVQYPGGFEQRQTDIEQGAALPAVEQVESLRRGCDALEERFASMPTWDGVGASLGGEVPVADLPYMRIREVEIHHVDLGIGYTFTDLPERYSREELRRMEMLWSARQPMGMTSLPAAALAAPPADRLAWLMGRATIAGLDPAGVF